MLQFLHNLIVAFLIALNLCNPKLRIGLGYLTTSAALRLAYIKIDIMAVPKASVYEYARPVTAQYNIGLARQSWMVESIAVTITP